MLKYTFLLLGEFYFIGDLSAQGIEEVLSAEEIACRRPRVYGLEPAPEDFICRKRSFALAGV